MACRLQTYWLIARVSMRMGSNAYGEGAITHGRIVRSLNYI